MTSMRERYPEAMAFVDLANATADSARTIWFGFLAFTTFLALALFGTSHRDLFLGTPLALPPPISIKINLVGFYVVAPLLLLALHIYMLLKLVLLVHVQADFEAQLSRDVRLASERAQARKHLNTTLFLRTLSAWKVGSGAHSLSVWLMTGLLVSSLALAPVATLLFTWIRFLPYQSEAVTMVHRIVLALDVAAVVLALRAVTGRAGPTWARWTAYGATALFVASVWTLLTFPRECWGAEEAFCWDRNRLLQLVGITRTLGYIAGDTTAEIVGGIETTALTWPRTTLQLANEDFVDDLRISDLSKVRFIHNLRERSLVGADLALTDLRKVALVEADMRAANLRGAKFGNADLSQAKMQGAKLFHAQMQGADLRLAQMQGADLRHAQMQGTDLRRAQMQGAELGDAQMQGATLLGAQMQGADLGDAQMQGANLRRAQMQGADLGHAQMQGTDLRRAQMQGADLRWAQMQGADLRWAQMQGANLAKAQMQGALLQETSVWRTSPAKIRGEPSVVDPIFRPLENQKSLVDRWLASIPPIPPVIMPMPDTAKERLAVLTREATPEDNVAAKEWAERAHGFADEAAHEAAIGKYREAFRDAILAYVCSDEPGVEPAIAGMFLRGRGVLVGDEEQIKSIRSEIERCRSNKVAEPAR